MAITTYRPAAQFTELLNFRVDEQTAQRLREEAAERQLFLAEHLRDYVAKPLPRAKSRHPAR